MAYFIKANAVYESSVRRLQNDIELVGFNIEEHAGGVYKITSSSGSSTWTDTNGDTWEITGITTDGALITTKI